MHRINGMRDAPGMSSALGRPPTATTMRRAVMVDFLPFLSVSSSVCGSTKAPSAFL